MAKVKICGIFRKEDCEYINEAAPDFAGFVFYEKSHRNVSEEMASLLRALIDKSIKTVGVFVNEDIDRIKRISESKAIDVIQLHGNEDEDYIKNLRKQVPGFEIWKAFKIKGKSDLDNAFRSSADMILFDSGYGTGKAFDWSLIKTLPKRKIIMAGGISEENMAEVIDRFHPYMLDLSSSVETERVKDREKINRAVKAARREVRNVQG